MSYKKIVIFGVGYIGSELAEQLSKKYPKAELHLVDKEFKPYFINLKLKKHQFHIFDIRETEKVTKVLEDADLCFPLAALVEAETSDDREKDIFLTNYHAVLEILKICTKNNIRVVFPSTTNVYGESGKKNLKETDTVKPKFAYAEYKEKIERKIRELRGNIVIARIATNYGYSKGIRFNLVINLFCKKILLNEPLIVFADGKSYRPYIHVQDTAKGLILLAEKGNALEIYNLGGENYRMNDLVKLFKILHHKTLVERKPEIDSPFTYHVNFNKIKALGFKSEWDVHEGIVDLLRRFVK